MLFAIISVVVSVVSVMVLFQGVTIGAREAKQHSCKRFDRMTNAAGRIAELNNTNIVR